MFTIIGMVEGPKCTLPIFTRSNPVNGRWTRAISQVFRWFALHGKDWCVG